jgi:hypothetical protein
MTHKSLESRIERARLNVKRATRRERPKAKQKLERLRHALALQQYAELIVRARSVGLEPIPGETYRELRRRVLLATTFVPKPQRRCEWKDGCYS